jgi:hypothetical protein
MINLGLMKNEIFDLFMQTPFIPLPKGDIRPSLNYGELRLIGKQ